MRLYTRWLNLSQNLLLDVTNLRLFFCVVKDQHAEKRFVKFTEISVLIWTT